MALAVLVGVLAALVGGTPAQAAYPTPGHLRAVSVTPTTLSLRWDPVAGASRYRVQLSTSSTMSSATYHRFSGAAGTIRNLVPKTKYHFRVAVIDPVSGAKLSAYTRPTYPSATTSTVPVPTNLRSTGSTSSSISLTWDASEGASLYRIQRSTSPDMSNASYPRSVTPTTTLTGLKAGTRYYFRVRVITSSGAGVTAYTPTPVEAATQAPPPPPTAVTSDIRVASFNVRGVNNDAQASGDERPWAERRAGVVGDILGERADVVGLQEANQSLIYGDRLQDGANQFLDLKIGLEKAGGHYALTDEDPYNCVRATSSRNCEYQDRGASGDTRILYNTDTVTMVSSGSFKYAHQSANKTDRYLVWAILGMKASGRQFLFTSTHLDPYSAADREAEWRELIAKVNQLKGSRPVVSVGDFNTSKFSDAAQRMLPAMKAAGYGDVLNQEYQVNPVRSPRAEKATNGWVNSFNDFRRDITPYSYEDRKDKAGNNIDWIFATNTLRVKEWKVVIDFDPSTLRVTGTIPSDHNMVRATLALS